MRKSLIKRLPYLLKNFTFVSSSDPLDWCSDDVSCIVEKTVAKPKENDIILMHDYYETSVPAALEVIDELEKEGYQFVTVDEILFD